MYDTPIWYLGETAIHLHWLMMALCVALSLLCGFIGGKKQGLKPAALPLFGLIYAALGLLIGRGIYAAVNYYEVFLNELGDFAGILPFFNPALGNVSVVGFFIGLPIAAFLASHLTGHSSAVLLDAATLPLLGMYVLARAIEPLSGQGYGDFLGLEVSVCWLEAALTAGLMILVPFLRRKCQREGTLFRYALVLFALLQILPESLRFDNALFVFIFARVTHLGLAFTLGLTLIKLLVIAGKAGLAPKQIALEGVLLALGIGVCIATIFALDKTNLPKLLVYAVMALSLIELGWLICRRIHKEDIRPC